MNKEQFNQYVNDARGSGMSHEQIAIALKQAGWDMKHILEIILDSATPAGALAQSGNAIIASNISKSFGKIQALKDISVTVPSGKVLALLGPNGAGKTTLVRILTTLMRADSGVASVAGFDAHTQGQQLRAVIGLTGQFAAIDEYLTGRENLELVGKLYHIPMEQARARAIELLSQFDLVDAADRIAKTYSGGMRRRLDLAASLVNKPKVLFLDEPTTGLDPQSRITLWGIIKQLVADGTTVLLTTQYLEEADHLADNIVVINHGQIIAQGTARELKAKIGGDVLEIHVLKPTEAVQVAELLKTITDETAHIEAEVGVVTIPTKRGADSLIEAVRLLDKYHIAIADIALRRPTLDDVFLKLTTPSN